MFIVEVVLLCFYWQAELWNWVDQMMVALGLCQTTYLKQDMAHAVLYSIVSAVVDTIIGTPFSVYETFVIEEKYGFNKTTPKTFVMDMVKSFMLMVVFTALLVPLLLWVVDVAGENLVFYLVSTTLGIIILF